MSLATLSDKALNTYIENYRRNGVTEGGRHSLGELLLESMKRQKSPFPHLEVARKIIELAKASSDGRTTYLDIWKAFRPGEAWKGNASLREVGQSLSKVIEYCVRHKLPLLSVLVVQSGSRRLADRAIANIYNDAKLFGVEVGLDRHEFVNGQAEKALLLVEADLPADSTVYEA